MASNSSSNAPIKAAAITPYKHAGAGDPPPSPRTSSGHLSSSSVAQSPRITPPPSPGITLLDVHEIEWIMAKLEHLINSSSSSCSSFSVPFPDEGPGDLRTVGRKNSFRKGFGSRFGRHATSLCGSDMDAVVETTRKGHAKQG